MRTRSGILPGGPPPRGIGRVRQRLLPAVSFDDDAKVGLLIPENKGEADPALRTHGVELSSAASNRRPLLCLLMRLLPAGCCCLSRIIDQGGKMRPEARSEAKRSTKEPKGLSAAMRCDHYCLCRHSTRVSLGLRFALSSSLWHKRKVTMSDQDSVKDEMATEAEAPKAEEGMDEDKPKDSGSDLIGSAAMR